MRSCVFHSKPKVAGLLPFYTCSFKHNGGMYVLQKLNLSSHDQLFGFLHVCYATLCTVQGNSYLWPPTLWTDARQTLWSVKKLLTFDSEEPYGCSLFCVWYALFTGVIVFINPLRPSLSPGLLAHTVFSSSSVLDFDRTLPILNRAFDRMKWWTPSLEISRRAPASSKRACSSLNSSSISFRLLHG